MTLLRAITQRWRDRPPLPGSREWQRRCAALNRNTDAEERLADLLTMSSPVPVNPLMLVDQILSLREARVELLRGLGRREAADELAADTAMRRKWTAEPPIF